MADPAQAVRQVLVSQHVALGAGGGDHQVHLSDDRRDVRQLDGPADQAGGADAVEGALRASDWRAGQRAAGPSPASPQAARTSASSCPWAATSSAASASARGSVRLATMRRPAPDRTSARAASSAVWPAPTSSTALPRRLEHLARQLHRRLRHAGQPCPSSVSARTRLPTRMARCISLLSRKRAVPAWTACPVRVPHLAQYLVLAEHLRVEAGRDPAQVRDRIKSLVLIEDGGVLQRRRAFELCDVGQHMLQGAALLAEDVVDFRAVARVQHHGFLEDAFLADDAQQLRRQPAGQGDLSRTATGAVADD